MAAIPDWQSRAHELVRAVKDVAPSDHPPELMPGSARHGLLFDRYVVAMSDAVEEAMDWWEALIDTEEGRAGDRTQAEAIVRSRRSVGPAGYGSVVYAVRTYWLECVALNRTANMEVDTVAPEEFLMLWLMRSGRQDLAQVLASLPYWPIGIDTRGQWT